MPTLSGLGARIDDAGLGQLPLRGIGQLNVGFFLECLENLTADTVAHDASQLDFRKVAQHEIHSAIGNSDESRKGFILVRLRCLLAVEGGRSRA
jgi:hypothetical protein